MSYQADLQDPRWQRKRLEIFQRNNFGRPPPKLSPASMGLPRLRS